MLKWVPKDALLVYEKGTGEGEVGQKPSRGIPPHNAQLMLLLNKMMFFPSLQIVNYTMNVTQNFNVTLGEEWIKFMHALYVSLSPSWLSCELDEKCRDFDFWICRDSVVGPDLRSSHPLPPAE